MAKLFLTILLLFGTVVIGAFFLLPEWQNYQKLESTASHFQEVSKKLDEIASARDELNNQINKISAQDRDRIKTTIPQGTHATEFLVLVESLTRNNGLVLSSIDISSASPQKTLTQSVKAPSPGSSPAGLIQNLQRFNEYPVTLTISGSYDSFKNFLKDLEQNTRLIDVAETSFASPNRKNEVITFALKLKTYYQ